MANTPKTGDQLSAVTTLLATDLLYVVRGSTTYQLTVANFTAFMKKTGAGTPVGSATPDFICQFYFDTTNNDLYVSNGVTNTSRLGPISYVV